MSLNSTQESTAPPKVKATLEKSKGDARNVGNGV